jgi:enoyl-CoA hydratase
MSDDFIIKNANEILDITINQPGRGNGMSDPMINELADLVEKEGDNVRLIVLRGAGKDFCIGRASMGAPRPAGLDAYQTRAISDHVFRCYGLFRKCNAPIMAVVQGQAAGFGFALAAAADITIAADTAKFSIPEFNHGIMPTMVMSSMIDRVPMKALMYHVWTSKVISAQKAMEIGAVSEVVPEAELEKTAQAFIDRMLHFKRPAVLAVKEYGVNAQAIDMSKAVSFARSLHAMVNSAHEMKRSEGHK